MTYQMYRSTILGECLERSLDELIADSQISKQLAARVMTTFDKCINQALSTRVRNKITFKAEKLRAYRFCDNVWTFVMEKVEFRDPNRPIDGEIDRVKFVACDAGTQKRNP